MYGNGEWSFQSPNRLPVHKLVSEIFAPESDTQHREVRCGFYSQGVLLATCRKSNSCSRSRSICLNIGTRSLPTGRDAMSTESSVKLFRCINWPQTLAYQAENTNSRILGGVYCHLSGSRLLIYAHPHEVSMAFVSCTVGRRSSSSIC